MTERQDPELSALAAVLRALQPLDREAKERVLGYANDKALYGDLNLKVDLTGWYSAINDALNAIIESAKRLRERGEEQMTPLTLISVISKLYEEAGSG